MRIPEATELQVRTLGECREPSPLLGRRERFASDSRVLVAAETRQLEPFLEHGPLPSFEAAGPRREVFFRPAELTCGIVTCGGLCPGVNDVIRSLVLTLAHGYGVRRVLGFRYVDPSYTIRSQPANSDDSSFCLMLGQHAVHAGMAGRTDLMVGFWNHRFTHVPLALVAGRRKHLDPDGGAWQRVLGTTGQPPSLVGASVGSEDLPCLRKPSPTSTSRARKC